MVKRKQYSIRTLFIVTFVMGGCFWVISLLNDAISVARQAADREVAAFTMRNICQAVGNHQSTYRDFPKNVLNDDQEQILSWRLVIVPFFIQSEMLDLTLPWDSDAQQNSIYGKYFGRYFQTFEYEDKDNNWETNIIAITGDGTAWDYEGKLSKKRFSDPANTIILIEVPSLGIHWMEPRDLSVDEFLEQRKEIFDPEIEYAVGFADGYVMRLNHEALMNLTRKDFMVQRGEVEVE